MDKFSKEQRSKIMRAIRSKGSIIETTLAKALFAKGYRYRKNDTSVFGKPDLTFKKYKIAVFVDSEFWHGKNWSPKKCTISTNRAFWQAKIKRNKQRDKEVNKQLSRDGWTVIRFWGEAIVQNLPECIEIICKEINSRKQKMNT